MIVKVAPGLRTYPLTVLLRRTHAHIISFAAAGYESR